MNYLAHLRLSPQDAESMVGNLMGDFRKYLGEECLPDNVNQGMKNHLRVDKFTDTNHVVRGVKCLFSHERRRFAGIIVDVTFDYFLVRHWHVFSNEELEGFIDRAHSKIKSKRFLMPGRMQEVMDYMIRENWLRSYFTLGGVGNALDRISTRIRFDNKLAGALEEIEMHYDELEQGFLQFFPELLEHVELNR